MEEENCIMLDLGGGVTDVVSVCDRGPRRYQARINELVEFTKQNVFDRAATVWEDADHDCSELHRTCRSWQGHAVSG